MRAPGLRAGFRKNLATKGRLGGLCFRSIARSFEVVGGRQEGHSWKNRRSRLAGYSERRRCW